MSTETTKKVANPGPLGLLGFGMTTVLLNLHNADLLPLSIMIVAMGICLGGLAQIIAGVRELCQGNTFGGTAFTAYGLFWWSLVLIWTNPFSGTEVAPGIDVKTQILDLMDFAPKMDGEPKLMNEKFFKDELVGLKEMI